MKRLFFVLIFFASVPSAYGVTFGPVSKVIDKVSTETKDAPLANAVTILKKIKTCVDDGQNISMTRACAVEKIQAKMSERDQDRLLNWFRYSYELGDFSVCPKDSVQFISDDKMQGIKLVACSSFKEQAYPRTVKFFFSDEGGLRLANIKVD